MKVKLVQLWQQKATHAKSVPVSHCCQLSGLSPSSDYAIAVQQTLPLKVDSAPIALKAAFIASEQTYGSRRLVRVLNQQGFSIGRCRVRTTDSCHSGRIAPNLLQQNFKVKKVNEVWVSDITYIRT